MPHLRTALSLVLLLAAGALLAPAARASRSTVRLGIGDQSAAMFTNPYWERLDIERTRYNIAWNAIDDPVELQRADAFVAAARETRTDVLLHITTDDYTIGESKLPTRDEYREKVGELVDRYHPLGVREWGVWNEANDRTQPTYRSPSRAAEFFIELWRMLDDADRCGRDVTSKCRVIALDLLDGRTSRNRGDTRSYIRRFYGRLGDTYDRRARFVGLHNYSDTNRRGAGGTKNAITELRRFTRRLNVWLTETGGVVNLGNSGSFRCDADSPSSIRAAERRADRAVEWMFRLTKRYRTYVDRLYVYQWTGTDCRERFDAGLTRADGSRRPAWYELFRQLRDSRIIKP